MSRTTVGIAQKYLSPVTILFGAVNMNAKIIVGVLRRFFRLTWRWIVPRRGQTGDGTMVTDKMRELVLYISRKCEADAPFGSTKLNKILFYSDFTAYQRDRKPITGHTYFKLPNGPAPRCMKPLLREMIADGDLCIQPIMYKGKLQKRPVALRTARLSLFTAKELAIVDGYIEKFWGSTASKVSDLSHGFIGWKLADIEEDIPYCMAFSVPVGTLTEKERMHGKSLLSPPGVAGSSLQ